MSSSVNCIPENHLKLTQRLTSAPSLAMNEELCPFPFCRKPLTDEFALKTAKGLKTCREYSKKWGYKIDFKVNLLGLAFLFSLILLYISRFSPGGYKNAQ